MGVGGSKAFLTSFRRLEPSRDPRSTDLPGGYGNLRPSGKLDPLAGHTLAQAFVMW